jgi:hypothetical protein
MGNGYLVVQATAGDEALPVAGAEVTIRNQNGTVLYRTLTDANGRTQDFMLPAPDKELTLCPVNTAPATSLKDVDIRKPGFMTKRVRGVEILDEQTAILPVSMEPIAAGRGEARAVMVDISPNRRNTPVPCPIRASSPARAAKEVAIPDYITVHLGKPENTAARSVRVKFSEYIKNVTSSEIYATWPEQSLRANIHAIVSFALNRVYTERRR